MSPRPAEFDALAADDLVHPMEAFAPEAQRANAQDWGNSQTLERFAWDYELLGQLERVGGDRITAFGGTAAMLHLPLAVQRASIDVDLFCSDLDTFNEIVRTVEARFAERLPDSYYFRLTPREPDLQIPIPRRAFDVVLPSATGASWKIKEEDALRPGTHIKVEVLIANPPGQERIEKTQVLPFAATGPHWALSRVDQTAMKVLALATGEVGLPPNRITELVKHVYDVAHLSLYFDSRDKLEALIDATARALSLENRWHTPKSTIERCATAVRTTVDLLEATVLGQHATQFAALYLRDVPTSEDWALWGKRTRHLAYVASKRHSIDDYLDTHRVTDRLLQRRLSPDSARALRKTLVKKLRSLDLASGVPSDIFPVVLFEEISFRVGHRQAAAAVAEVLGPDWEM